MGTLDDVARAAGVSKSVASRALTGDAQARMSEATRARVLAAAEQLDYVPNARARALRQSRSGAIGLIVPDVNNAVFADMLAGVQSATAAHGTDVLLGQVDVPPAGAQQLSRLVREGRVDGLLIQRREDFDDAMLAAVLKPGVPAITINSRLPDRRGSVILDDERGSAMATEHVIGLGHRHIAFISGTQAHDTARRRKKGYLDAMAAAGLTPDPRWVVDAGWEADAGAHAFGCLHRDSGLGVAGGPTAVVVASVNAAVGALAAALRLGIPVPEDLSIIGINTTWVSDTVYPALTTVRLPLRRLGELATTMLLNHLGGAPLEDIVVDDPAPELVINETTAPRAGA
ncbi:LacI family transcriptional regulator [Mycobacterium sp. 21AC1]|uniref:LacI family DNA-binding transcriptional regulator n=1 Tax=[Mycobacterium] appelbergii TaxID=2939269 RepID=UPI002939294E|nr:LacI family DNA-binding transcriptional regulator [Mycobacterium sp. 21AC1]MDV3129051.1 LacI family transcriptional regulator [Mycobacterium sp. 21AC1]